MRQTGSPDQQPRGSRGDGGRAGGLRFIRTLLPPRPLSAWQVLAGICIARFGFGLILPFVVLYLHKIRGIPLGLAGAIVALAPLIAIPTGFVAGSLVDRWGTKPVVIGALLLEAVSTTMFGFATNAVVAVAASVVGGLSAGGAQTPALLADLVDAPQRASVFALNYALTNLGIGFGGLIGGAIADFQRPFSLQLLFFVDAAAVAAFALVLLPARVSRARPRLRARGEAAPAVSYRAALADRPLVLLVLINLIAMTVGPISLNSAFPTYAMLEGHLSPHVLGIAYAGNTFFIVLAQLLVLRFVEGRRRTAVIQLAVGLFGVAWLMTFAGATEQPLRLGGGIFVLAMIVFALGEMLLAPTVPVLVNDIAPEQLRGRYNAAYASSFQVSMIVTPAASGALLGAGLSSALVAANVGLSGLTGVLASRLRHALPFGRDTPAIENRRPLAPEAGPARGAALSEARQAS